MIKIKKTSRPVLFGLFLITFGLISCTQHSPLSTVQSFSPARYSGVWHEIGRLPNPFERNIIAARATYQLRQDGSISVLNEGIKADGKKNSITGRATPVGDVKEGKLKVRFDPFPASLFAGDYWVLFVDTSYQNAIVGSPNRKLLWLLSKNPKASLKTFQSPLEKLSKKGFPTEKIILNPKRILSH